MDKELTWMPLLKVFPQLVAAASVDGGEDAAKAIITTDLVTKSIALETIIDDRPVRIGGIAKGSGHDSSQHGNNVIFYYL